ncbi:MAG: rhomboid family intramembrane serine protease [Pseudohongiellaceae bacterium]
MQRVASLESHLDLRPLIVVLAQRGIHIQVTEESGRQVVWAMDVFQAEQVARVLEDWQSGRLELPELDPASTGVASPGARDLLNRLLQAGWYAPVSMTTIALCLVVALVSRFGTNLEPVRWMFFPDIDFGTGNAFIGLLAGISGVMDVVRLFTPALLHFGIIHVVFNTLWLWHLGRMIEDAVPGRGYVGLILVTAFSGNVAQFLWSGGEPNFGGMSGVVYGLIGFIWMWQTCVPYTRLSLPPAMIGIFLVALVLMEVLASAFIATAAHVGGLVSGMVYGVAMAMLFADRTRYD